MEYDNNYCIKRRASYWRNSVYELEQTLEHFSKHMAETWVSLHDRSVSKTCENLLKEALRIALLKQKQVIEAQLELYYSGEKHDEEEIHT